MIIVTKMLTICNNTTHNIIMILW